MKIEEKGTLWLDHINSYRASNLTAEAWCEQNNVKINALRRWITKFNKESQSASTSNWVEVDVSTPVKATTSDIRINIGSASIDVPSDFNPKTLEAVIAILSRQC